MLALPPQAALRGLIALGALISTALSLVLALAAELLHFFSAS